METRKNYNKKINDTCVRIGEVRMSYAHVFSARESDNGGDAKYSVCLLIPKEDTKTVEAVRAAIEAATEKGKAEKWSGSKPRKFNDPLRDGDEEDKGPEYEGMYFLNASSKQKPGVRVLENGKIIEALDEEDFYSGCWGAATINFFPYGGPNDKKTKGNTGVGVGLNNLIKTRDDERLSGGTTAEQDFGDMGDCDELD